MEGNASGIGAIAEVSKYKTFLDKYLMDKMNDKEEHVLKHNEYFASQLSISWKVIRAKRFISDIDLETARIFEIGNILHEFIQKELFNTEDYEIEKRIEKTIKLPEKVRIRGRMDIFDKYSNEVIELKTVSELPSFPNETHLAQLHFYMFATKVNTGYIIYINKNNLEFREFRILFSKNYWKKVLEAVRYEYLDRVGDLLE